MINSCRAAALLLMVAICFAPAARADKLPPATYRWPVLAVVDGDTLRVAIPGLPPELNPVGIRVLGVNTPETGSRAQCPAERALGGRAKDLVIRMVADAKKHGWPIGFQKIGWDKYGGRIDAVVLINGTSLADTLIKHGLGRPYDGGKRGSWCG